MYWKPEIPDDPNVQSECDALMASEITRERYVQALDRLLDSDSIVAQGIAIDVYSADQMSGRFGSTPASSQVTDKVARRIREHLRAPPFRAEWDEHGEIAMNHACALEALRWVVIPRDAELIARVATQVTDPITKQSLVGAVDTCMRICRSELPDAMASEEMQTLHRVLMESAQDETLEQGARERAVFLLSADVDADAEGLLLELLEHEQVDLAAAAAIALIRTHFDEHRSRIAERLDAWKDCFSSKAEIAQKMFARKAGQD